MEESKEKLGAFEKYLAVWVIACMAVGLILSQYLPGLSEAIDGWQVRGISVPIGVCLFLMMYPALLNLRLAELMKLAKNPKPIILTLFSNWIIAPIVTVILANLFLTGYDQLMVSLILLGSSPCTAMVLVWGSLAEGNQEQNFITTSLNTVTIMLLYAPVVSLLTGVQNIAIDRTVLALSVLVFIGLPIVLGYFSKKYLTQAKGEEWFQGVYRPVVGKVSMMALLTTLIVLFSLNGDVLTGNLDLYLEKPLYVCVLDVLRLKDHGPTLRGEHSLTVSPNERHNDFRVPCLHYGLQVIGADCFHRDSKYLVEGVLVSKKLTHFVLPEETRRLPRDPESKPLGLEVLACLVPPVNYHQRLSFPVDDVELVVSWR